MKATKVILTIKVEVLSVQSAPALLGKVIGSLQDEFQNGQLVADDGDTVTWSTKQEPVTI